MKSSKSSPKEPKPNEPQQNSVSIDDNYNQEEGLQEKNKIQKLSIMDDFNELCHKLNQPPPEQITETPAQNTLAHYYAKLKQKNQSSQDLKKDTNNNNLIANLSQKQSNKDTVAQKINKSSPVQTHHVRSSSSNILNTQQQNNSLQAIKHQRNPSQGEAFKKKIIQEMEMNDSKRNYSSVEEKKKILQPSKNVLNTHQNLSMKDYYGDQKNISLKKQTIKNMVPKEAKHLKQTILNSYTSQTKQTHSHKFNKQNNLKQSNMIKQPKKMQTIEPQKASKVIMQKESQKNHFPQIVLISKRINLNEDPKILEAMLKEAQSNETDMSNVSVNSTDEGLFGNAIEKQRNAKTSQTVQSPQIHINLLPPNRKEQIIHNPKQYISSPINITHSPNPTNAPKSIFQKRQIYRC